tara:strand:+ start:887 stop:1063 length:177 start_codon:yes stop_codon:yes gene_type:complete
MGLEDILSYIENIIETIEFDETTLSEVHDKLQELAIDLEDNLVTSGEEEEEFDFGDFI